MPDKLKVQTKNGEIEIEEGDRFYHKHLSGCVFRFTRELEGEEGKPWWVIKNNATSRTDSIDFNRPAPDADGWYKNYGFMPDGLEGKRIEVLDGSGGIGDWGNEPECYGWENKGKAYDIIKYRILEEKKQADSATKHDQRKERVFKGLIEQFPEACRVVAKLSEFGAEKYAWGNWRGVEADRYKDALMRHVLGAATEGVDSETGLSHWVHVAWCAMAIVEKECEKSK